MASAFPHLADSIDIAGNIGDYPIDAILFCCTMNSVRSAMAEGLAKQLFGTKVYFDSAGIRQGTLDYLMVETMQQINSDMSHHKSKLMDDLEDTSFDLIITLSPEAHHHALDFSRTMACEVEFWNMMDPTIIEGSRDNRLFAYAQVREQIKKKLMTRLAPFLS